MDSKIEIYEKRLFELIDSLKKEVTNNDMEIHIRLEILKMVGYLSLIKIQFK